jgi:hypothetical protein
MDLKKFQEEIDGGVAPTGGVADLGEVPLVGASVIKNKEDDIEERAKKNAEIQKLLRYRAFKTNNRPVEKETGKNESFRLLNEVYSDVTVRENPFKRYSLRYEVACSAFRLVSESSSKTFTGNGKELRRVLETMSASFEPDGSRPAVFTAMNDYPGFSASVYLNEKESDKVSWDTYSPQLVVGDLVSTGNTYTLNVQVKSGNLNKDYIFNASANRMAAILKELGGTLEGGTGGPTDIVKKASKDKSVQVSLNFDQLTTIGKAYATQVIQR